MSGEHDPAQRIGSPLSSGRSSPGLHKAARQRDEDNLLKRDKGYRRYASTVERVLLQFETVGDWADYITFLGRLLKALSLKPSGFAEVPHKFLVAKRLSQCLNPVLPSGVHQKSLEVYSYVFSTLGKEGLATDLGLYLPGLAPILSFAALSVKPNVLAVFETYIVPLRSSAIRPALKSILLALLPGLEEENGDEFDRTLRILAALKVSISRDYVGSADTQTAASEQYFWQCMFLASITSSTRRPGALAYLTRNLPHLGNTIVGTSTNGATKSSDSKADRLNDAIEAVVTPEPGLLVRCFCAGLRDDRLLIQRGFLDLLVTHLPLNSSVMQEKVIPADLEKLVIAASSVVARKDMSLNRRLWSWFLGPEPTTDANGSPSSPRDEAALSPSHNIVAFQTQHFEQCGLEPLVSGILSMINSDSQNPSERTKALRTCLSLMDRWEIGGLVIPRIFLPAMKNIWTYQSSSAPQDSKHEVLRSANMFFDGVESSLIWSEICEITANSLNIAPSRPSDAQEMLEMVLFMITNFNIREEEMQTVHMPLVVLMIIVQLQRSLHGSSPTFGRHSSINYGLRIALKLLELVPARALIGTSPPDSDTPQPGPSTSPEAILSVVQAFYEGNRGNIDAGRPFPEALLGQLILNESLSLTTQIIAFNSPESHAELDQATLLLRTSIKKGKYSKPNLDTFLDMLLVGFEELQAGVKTRSRPFSITSAQVAIIEAISSSPNSSNWISPQILRSVLPALVHEVWPALSASRPKHNVEAVRAIWTLYMLCQERQLIDSTIVTLMVHANDDSTDNSIEEEDARRFTTLWAHSQNISSAVASKQTGSLRGRSNHENTAKFSTIDTLLERPLMLLLDSLEDPKSSRFPFVVGWLQSLSSLNPILDLLIVRLSALHPVATLLRPDPKADAEFPSDDPDGLQLCCYYLQMIHNVIQHSSGSIWDALDSPSHLTSQHENILDHQDFLIEVSMRLLQARQGFSQVDKDTCFHICQTSLALLELFLQGPFAARLIGRKLELPLAAELVRAVEHSEHLIQTLLMEVILAALRPRYQKDDSSKKLGRQRSASKEIVLPASPIRASTEVDEKNPNRVKDIPPSALLDCILIGLKSPKSRPVLEAWTTFLSHCLAFYGEGLFQVLLPLIGCFCDTLEGLGRQVDRVFRDPQLQISEIMDPSITILLNGLEQSLATAHDVMVTSEANAPPMKSPEPQQGGFFGSMVGAFASDAPRTKALTANDRLTVLLCFKDAMKVCYTIWAWGDSSKDSLDNSAQASYKWTALRLRNRTRRIFEHLFAAEALECLETLIDLWQQAITARDDTKAETVLSLLSVLESSRPKITMPAIFNAIYSRTNPGALEPNRTSTLTSDLSDVTLANFLVTYLRALDDDAMDEIWNDCIVFLKDLLANPMPHRQTLPSLIEFTAILGEKVDNTTFGEQKKLRRELGDLFVRLLTATLTIRPMGTSAEVIGPEKSGELNGTTPRDVRPTAGSEGFVAVLATITPTVGKVLLESDRVSSTCSTISTQVVSPIFRSKSFPTNINKRTLELVKALLGLPEAAKFIKKDISDAFNDSKFFSTPLTLATNAWLPIIQSWALADKEKMPELLTRLVSPTVAGVLGIGANSARMEADKRAQLNLRRIALLILASAKDTYVVNLALLQGRLIDTLHASTTSSPSSVTRSEVYMVIRALLLKVSPPHLSPFWPTIHSELFEALSSSYPSPDSDPPNPLCQLQACKLLDTLLTLGIDDFQMQEWIYISDTTDAVYRPANQTSVALADDLAQTLDEEADSASGLDSTVTSLTLHATTTATSSNSIAIGSDLTSEQTSGGGSGILRKPLLTGKLTTTVPRDEIVDRVLRPFLRQLSISAFESTYGLQNGDWDACFAELMADLFDETTLV